MRLIHKLAAPYKRWAISFGTGLNVNATFVTPAARPFTAAIARAPPDEILRVKLLSIAQHRQVAAMADNGASGACAHPV